jgi:adenylyl cyclase-associated protein
LFTTNRSGVFLTAFRRIEADTSILQHLATTIDSSHPQTVATISNAQSHAANAAAAATAAPLAPPAAAEPLPASIEDFDKLIDENVRAFVTSSEKIGGLVGQQV